MDEHDAEHELASHAIIATSRCERWFARSLDKSRGSSSRGSWRRNDQSDLR
jgi:hypothetical protein